MLLQPSILSLALHVLAAAAAPTRGNTWTLHVEGTSPGSGEIHDTPISQDLPGFNHMLRNESTAPALEAADDHFEDDPSLGITFDNVCRRMTLSGSGKIGETTMDAECVDEYGRWWITSLNLNECAANVAGQLAYQDQGNFDESCRPCVLSKLRELDGLLLKCNCMRGGVPQYASLPMGLHVDHPRAVRPVGGRLMCGDRLGSKTPSFSNN